MFDDNNENLENNGITNYYENLNSNTTDSNNAGVSEGSDNGYSRSYYKSPYEGQNNMYHATSGSNGSAGPGKSKKNKNGFGKKVAVVATLSILGGGLAGASFEAVRYISGGMNTAQVASVDLSGVDANDKTNDTQSNSTSEAKSVVGTDSTIASTDTTQLATTVTDVSSVVDSVMPSVVSITNVVTTQVQVPYPY